MNIELRTLNFELRTPNVILLFLNNISLLQFKNYRQSSFHFTERIVSICGKNGIGKTNLLDAIYYLCFTKSYFTRTDAQSVYTGTQGFRIEASIDCGGRANAVICILRETGKKEMYVDGSMYSKFSEHIGKFPCVVIAPDDVQIVTGGSEERRRFLDALLSQLDHAYLTALINYNKVLQQRNSLLKSFADTNSINNSLLEVMNEQLIQPGSLIFEKRKTFLQGFIATVKSFYLRISGEAYDIDVEYQSQLLYTSLDTLLHQFRDKDLVMQRTNAGIHKDDLDIQLKGLSFKSIASQGQRKSLLFALKLAEFDSLKKTNNFAPLLLLDDVFEKLDEGRMQNLLQWVCKDNNGQIFITDTHCKRLKDHLNGLQVDFQLIEL